MQMTCLNQMIRLRWHLKINFEAINILRHLELVQALQLLLVLELALPLLLLNYYLMQLHLRQFINHE